MTTNGLQKLLMVTAERRSTLLQAELEKLKVSRETWSKKVEQLKEALADSKLEEAIGKQLQEPEKLHWRELLKEGRSDPWRPQPHDRRGT